MAFHQSAHGFSGWRRDARGAAAADSPGAVGRFAADSARRWAVPDRVAQEGQRLTFALAATDANGDTLLYTAENLPAAIAELQRALRLDPGHAQARYLAQRTSMTELVRRQPGLPRRFALERGLHVAHGHSLWRGHAQAVAAIGDQVAGERRRLLKRLNNLEDRMALSGGNIKDLIRTSILC